ncbi:GNAT family N-acetyltransferase [Kocuria sp. CPCC 205258]|uniref:GNAT family N-acetyltransferase n=1 Tax=Kocuria sp. CPCC 205258 TaxID=3073552 RepID=UPI0034D569DA
MSPRIRPAATSDLDAAARVLAAAFGTYSWTRWTVPADGCRTRLEEIQRLYLSHTLEHGIVLVDEQVSAVAAFPPADAADPPAPTQRRIAELLGARLTALAGLDLPAAPVGSWTLETVGVHPAQQGAALGTAVIAAGLSMIDRPGEPVALETSDERNVHLYRRLGFATTAITAIPAGPIVYSMSRTTSRG